MNPWDNGTESFCLFFLPAVLGGEGGPPKPPVQAFMLFCSEKRGDAMKELATSDGKGDEEIEEPEDDEDEDEEGSKKKSKGGGMAANAAIVKKLGAMWAAASADEKATFEAQVAKQKEVGADTRQV